MLFTGRGRLIVALVRRDRPLLLLLSPVSENLPGLRLRQPQMKQCCFGIGARPIIALVFLPDCVDFIAYGPGSQLLTGLCLHISPSFAIEYRARLWRLIDIPLRVHLQASCVRPAAGALSLMQIATDMILDCAG